MQRAYTVLSVLGYNNRTEKVLYGDLKSPGNFGPFHATDRVVGPTRRGYSRRSTYDTHYVGDKIFIFMSIRDADLTTEIYFLGHGGIIRMKDLVALEAWVLSRDNYIAEGDEVDV